MRHNKIRQAVTGLLLTLPFTFAKPIDHIVDRQAATTASGCAAIASSSSALAAENPQATRWSFAPGLALDCLNSIPNRQQEALDLINSLRALFEFQSDIEYLAEPPPGYLNPAFNVYGYFDLIERNVRAESYTSEFSFQLDLYYLTVQMFDGHVSWGGDILRLFVFVLQNFQGLSSVSVDGVSIPEIFFSSDLFTTENGTNIPISGSTVSPVTTVNGIDIVEAAQVYALFAPSQDPDARYNAMFHTLLANPQEENLFFALGSGVGNVLTSLNFTFANGSSAEVPLIATTRANFTGVTDGDSAYDTLAFFADSSFNTNVTAQITSALSSSEPTAVPTTTTSAASATSASATATPTNIPLPNIPGFPYPVIKDSLNSVAGYYLNGSGYEDVAVLQLSTFEAQGAGTDWVEEIADLVANFAGSAVNDSKTKLVIDLQGNPGGFITLGTIIFEQLFPNIAPNTKSNLRRSFGLDVVVEELSYEVQEVAKTNLTQAVSIAFANAPFDFQEVVTVDDMNVTSVDEFLSGTTFKGANFTAFFQDNYSVLSFPKSSAPPFAPENIIMLTDGFCASTCTVFSEHMKNQAGVQVIALGGRPFEGAMQAVGGVKGSQVFEGPDSIYKDILGGFQAGVYNQNLTNMLEGTIWNELNDYSLARTFAAAQAQDVTATDASLNGRNAFRIGDDTNTPTQYVYEAADCRMWFTPEMLWDANALWTRVADAAFNTRENGKWTSPYCVAGSTGQPTSLSGGLKQGTLGPQNISASIAGLEIFSHAPWQATPENDKVVAALGLISTA